MPGMSGVELQSYMLANGHDALHLRHRVRPGTGSRAGAAAGAFGYLSKPCDEECLISCLDKALADGTGAASLDLGIGSPLSIDTYAVRTYSGAARAARATFPVNDKTPAQGMRTMSRSVAVDPAPIVAPTRARLLLESLTIVVLSAALTTGLLSIIGLPGHGVVEGKVFRDRLPQGEAAPAHMLRVPAFHAPSQGVERDPRKPIARARPATRLVAIERREGVNTSVLLRIPGSEVAAREAAPPLLLRGNAMTILSASFLDADSSESELLQKVLHPAGSSRAQGRSGPLHSHVDLRPPRDGRAEPHRSLATATLGFLATTTLMTVALVMVQI